MMTNSDIHRAQAPLLLLGILFSALFWPTSAIAEPTETAGRQTLILFDSSGSMWGKFTGTRNPKFKLAAASLGAALKKHNLSEEQLGLIVFGGRCTSAPLLFPPTHKPAASVVAKIDKLNPKGKGPISLALETAQKNLSVEPTSSVIIVHDGADNCKRDLCTAAQAFAQSHKGIPVHLISIGLTKAAKIATACVAKQTGGTVTQVETAEQMIAAFDNTVRLTMRGGNSKKRAPATAQSQDETADEPPTPDKTGPSRLRMRATLGTGNKTLAIPVRWQIRNASPQTETPILDVALPRLTVPLEPGKYRINATVGMLAHEQEITVAEKGATDLVVAFDGGQIILNAKAATTSGTPLPEGLKIPSETSTIVTLHAEKPASLFGGGDKETKTKVLQAPIVIPSGSSSSIVVPAGTYKLTIEKGRTRSHKSLTVSAGETTSLDIGETTGELKLALNTATTGTATQGILYRLYVDDPDKPSGRREIARSAATSPSFTVAAGTYYVSAQIGHASAKSRVAINPGEQKTHIVDVPHAILRVKTQLEISAKTTRLPIQYRVIHLDKAETEVAVSGKKNPKFTLAPGRYRIIAEIGARNVAATAEVDLPNASKTTVTLNPRAGEVKLVLADQASSTTLNRYWVVRDQTGAIIWRTNAYTPSAVLAPGTYEVSCDTRHGVWKTTFKVAQGESKDVKLSQP